MPEPDQIAELLAERQWHRMTRSSTPWDQLNESDRRACRAIVQPILDDLAELSPTPATENNGSAALTNADELENP